MRLFERNQRTVALTEAGRYLYERTSASMRQYEETMAHLKALAEHYHGYLKVGVGMYEYCGTEGFFSSFLISHPEIKLDILQYPYSTLTEKLRTGELDIIIGDALCEEAFASKELQTRLLFESPNHLVASKELMERMGAASPEELLKDACLITNCEGSGPSDLQMLRNLVMEEYGFLPRSIAQTNSVNAQLMMVRAGHGEAIVPGFILKAQGAGLISSVLPAGRLVRYELMRLTGAENPFVDVLFHFEPEEQKERQ